MANSIFPDGTSAGGIVIRDVDGNPTHPTDVNNAYAPLPPFDSNCLITALPSTCEARIESRQVNAIVSELVAFAECLDPDGAWDCNSLKNLCASFGSWIAAGGAGTGGAADATTVYFDTVTTATAAHIAASRTTLITSGYYASGDGGGAQYKKVGVMPSHICKFQSADGAWWELAEVLPNLLQTGAKRDDVTDTAPYLNGLMQYVFNILGNGGLMYVPAGYWNVATSIIPKSFMRVICSEAATFRVRCSFPLAMNIGAPVEKFVFEGGTFHAQPGFTNGTGMYLRSIQFSNFRRTHIRGFTNGIGIVIQPDNNTASCYNVFDAIEINSASTGIRLLGDGGPPAGLVTANHWTNMLLLGITGTGVDIAKYCDNEYWSNLRVELAANGAKGIVMNSDPTLATVYGHVYGHDFDSMTIGAENLGLTSVIAVQLNASYQTNITPISVGPDNFPGTVILDNAGMSLSHNIVVSNMSLTDRRQYFMIKGVYNKAQGTSAIPVGVAFIDIAHGMASSPTRVQIMPTSLFPTPWLWSNVSGTTFRVQVGTNVTGSPATFGWVAEF